MLWENAICTGSLEIGPVHVFTTVGSGLPPTSSGAARENVPLTRRPEAVVDGSVTDSAASPALEITVAVVLAVYVPFTPGMKAPSDGAVPSVSESVAGTVPLMPPLAARASLAAKNSTARSTTCCLTVSVVRPAVGTFVGVTANPFADCSSAVTSVGLVNAEYGQ